MARNTFAKRLMMLRAERGESQADIAREIGVSIPGVSRWENGNRTPRSDSIIALCKHYNVSADYLLGLTDIRYQLNPAERKNSGLYECFHCGSQSVVWDADFDFSDYGFDGGGIVHACHCVNCGASIEYYISTDEDTPDEDYSTKE